MSHIAGVCTEQHILYPTDIIIARELTVRITAKLIPIRTLHLQFDDSSPCNSGSQIEVLKKKIYIYIYILSSDRNISSTGTVQKTISEIFPSCMVYRLQLCRHCTDIVTKPRFVCVCDSAAFIDTYKGRDSRNTDT